MFRSHKQLIRTPTERKGPRRTEFTPVGATKESGIQLDRESAIRNDAATGSPVGSSKNQYSAPESSFIGDPTSSSFASLADSPGRTRIYKGTDIFPDSSSDDEDLNTFQGRPNLVGGSTTLVRKQADEVQRLRHDNFNLRVELMSLKKGLQGLPQDKKALISENTQLSKELIQLQRTLQDKENTDPSVSVKQVKESYESKIREYEERLADTREQLKAAEEDREKADNQQQDLDDELSSLRLQVDELKEQLRNRPENTDEKDDQIMDLQSQLDRAEADADRLLKLNDSLSDQLEGLRAKAAERSSHDDREEALIHDQLDKAIESNTQMHDKLDSENKKIQNLQKEIERMTLANSQLQRENDELHDKIDSMRTRKEKATDLLKGEIENVYGRASQFQGEKAELRKRLQSIEEILADTQRNQSDDYVADIEADRKDLYDSLLQLNEKYKGLQDKLKLQSSAIEDKEKQIEELLHANKKGLPDKLQRQLASQRAEFDSLAKEYSEKEDQLIDELTRLRDEKSSLVSEYQSIQREVESLRAERKIDPQEFDKLQSDFIKVSSEYSKLTSESELREQEYLIYKENCKSLEDQLRSDIRFRDGELQRLRSELSSTYSKEERAHLEHLLKVSDDEKTTLKAENFRLSEQLVTLRSRSARLQARVESMLSNDAESRKVKNIEDELEKANDRNAKLSSQLRKSNHELEDLRARLEDTANDKEELLNSLNKLDRSQKNAMDKNSKLSEELKSIRSMNFSGRDDLQAKISAKNAENKKLVGEYNAMKNELLDRLEGARNERKDLENDISELKETLKRFRIKEQVLLQEQEDNKAKVVYPPTPKTPDNPAFPQSATPRSLEARIGLLEGQRELYRLKLQELNDSNSDLKFANEYLSKELRSKEKQIEKNIALLQASSRDPIRHQANKPKHTFEGSLLAVVAAIRLGKRLEEMKQKKIQERSAKARIIKLQKSV
ncbi:DEKNAAC100901 [Brettanomyces naardenensis]|uniref:DEKNAAC100901 n=1 Tax=Brettanomyces naardenensis TaxID=13370 RepID=A0A448YGM2_BRENA|nr:DEKNAAC100901 [Brettanomyces naardenensis]